MGPMTMERVHRVMDHISYFVCGINEIFPVKPHIIDHVVSYSRSKGVKAIIL